MQVSTVSKYDPLAEHLRRSTGRIELSFADIEAILGAQLPGSARRHAAWWSNSGGTHVQALAWLSVGYRSEQVNLEGERLTFVPERSAEGFSEMAQAKFKQQETSEPEHPSGAEHKRHPAFGVWKGKVTLLPDYDYTQPADPDWGKVYED